MPERVVTVVLLEPRRVLAPFTLDSPWWSEVASVVEAVRERHGLEIVVLRLLDAEHGDPSPVTYLAEVAHGDASQVGEPWLGTLDDDPLRLPYALAGGPADDLGWAARFVDVVGPPAQVKTWNLSSIWRLPTATGTVWLKHVPPFFAHEPAVLDALGPDAPVPPIVAGEPGRMLLADVPGEDCWTADASQLVAMVDALVTLQASTVGRVDELLGLGVADWRAPAFARLAADVIARDAGPAEAGVLAAFVDGLPGRFAELAACGLPDVLVHGDFHPGNVRWSRGRPVLLDWGDCGIGHPLLDLPAFLQSAAVTAAGGNELRCHWLDRWSELVPGSDPARAAELVAPVAALRQAVVYRSFLDGIERTEQVYHRDDVPEWLGRTAALLRRSEGSRSDTSA